METRFNWWLAFGALLAFNFILGMTAVALDVVQGIETAAWRLMGLLIDPFMVAVCFDKAIPCGVILRPATSPEELIKEHIRGR